MTREEAIEILEANRPDPCYQMLREAVDFAVDALKAQLPSAQPKQDREFMKLTFRNSDGRPYFSIIYLEFDDNGIGQDFEGYSSYSLDVISDYLKKYFMPPTQPNLQPTCNELATDTISRQAVVDAIDKLSDEPIGYLEAAIDALVDLPSAQPEQHEIGYSECANAMLKMWIDNVLTDGEYGRIMDKLNAHWAERREE